MLAQLNLGASRPLRSFVETTVPFILLAGMLGYALGPFHILAFVIICYVYEYFFCFLCNYVFKFLATKSLMNDPEHFHNAIASNRIKITRSEKHRKFAAEDDSAERKQIKAAITVASNLYLHTIPGAEDAPVPLQFSLPDSRYRYLVFCLSAVATACAREMKNHDAVVNKCLYSLVMWTTTENVQEFFGGPVNPQDVANNGAAHLQEFLNNWSRYVDLDKEGRYTEGVDLICSMIHTTESNVPAGKADEKRLGELGLQIACRLPTMRGAFIELVNQ